SDTATVNSDGTWSLAPLNLSGMANGTLSVTASYVGAGGTVFSDGATVLHDKAGAVTIDSITSDTGVLSDFVTSDKTLVFKGSATAGATVTLTLTGPSGGFTNVNVTANSGGTWTYDYTGTALSEGSYTLEAVSGATVTQSIAIDSTAPAGPVTVNSQTTADTTPTISGTATLAAGESLFVTVNGVTYEVGDGNLGLSGSNWTLVIPASDALTPASVLGGFSGVYDVVATARDTAGNTRTDSTSAELTVQDTTAPLIDLAPCGAVTVNRTVTSANGASVSLDNDASPAVIIEASDRITNLTVAVAGLKDGTSERLLFGGNPSVAANGASAAQSDILVGGVRVNVNYAGGAFTIQKSDYSALTAAEAQAVLRDIRYQDVASLPSTGARAFAFSATDDAGNVSANATSTVTVTDTIAPTLVSSTPADDATGVAVGSNLVLNFNEPVSAGTGNIVIGDGTDIHT